VIAVKPPGECSRPCGLHQIGTGMPWPLERDEARDLSWH
jgi:hypothetical protein